MIKIISVTLEEAYKEAASKLECSVTELNIEVVQFPSSGFLGLFKKTAIVVAAKKKQESNHSEAAPATKKEPQAEIKKEFKKATKKEVNSDSVSEPNQSTKVNKQKELKQGHKKSSRANNKSEHNLLNDTIMPESFVSTQDDEDYDMADINFTADYEDDDSSEPAVNTSAIAKKVEEEINTIFDLTCFEIDKIEVSAYDEETLLIEFKGEDAALLIGKEGYRYKALSYMIFNWINTKYQLQLRLEIAEFLKNQEESVARYLVGICENVDRDGRAQTKILDGVLVQIALKELRDKYPNKYVAIRSTRDGLKFIIINDYHN